MSVPFGNTINVIIVILVIMVVMVITAIKKYSLVQMNGWVNGYKSRFRDWLQQPKILRLKDGKLSYLNLSKGVLLAWELRSRFTPVLFTSSNLNVVQTHEH